MKHTGGLKQFILFGTVSFVTPDDKYIAFDADSSIVIFDTEKWSSVKMFEGHTEDVKSINYSPHGDYLVSGSVDNTVKIWDISSGECRKTLEGHNDEVRAVVFSPDGKLIVSGSVDGFIKIFSIYKSKRQNIWISLLQKRNNRRSRSIGKGLQNRT